MGKQTLVIGSKSYTALSLACLVSLVSLFRVEIVLTIRPAVSRAYLRFSRYIGLSRATVLFYSGYFIVWALSNSLSPTGTMVIPSICADELQ